MIGKKPKIINDFGNLESEIGHLVVNAEIKGDITEWLEKCDGNIEKCLIIWIAKDTGNLQVFGTQMKCVEAIGYMEVAKGDLLDYMYQENESEDIEEEP